MRTTTLVALGAGLATLASMRPAAAQTPGLPTSFAVTRAAAGDLRAVDQQVDLLIRSRALRVRESQPDALVPNRQHERLDQYLRGVRIVGGDMTRQIATDGTVSLFGTLHGGLDDFNVTAQLSPASAAQALARAVGGTPLGGDAELVILPLSDGYHLAYAGQAIAGLEIVNVYIDANTGGLLQQYSDFLREVGSGKGTYGDTKKVSARAVSGTFVTDDPLRPAAVTTYDMKGNLARLTALLNRVTSVAPGDIASDSDNAWTDGAVVDAHVYAGWYYDFLFKRFGRHGLDNRDLRMALFTHPVRLQDIATAPPDVFGLYYLNAFYCRTCLSDGRGAMVFGEGAPLNYFRGIEVKPFSAALDVVAHELTHGVTGTSAQLNGFPYSEAGALNEAFSDIVGVSTAFYHEPAGTAPLAASYLMGKDLTVPSGLLSRSLSNPAQFGDPDHYTQREIGGDPHSNSTIASHAFYLAIEGGTHRTSRLTVQGVGAANRDQIEKAFFRALTVLLPSSATFAITRVATIQAARDLYGSGSAAERAITQAWDAVGVQERTAPTIALLPSPATSTTRTCGGDSPSWTLGITLSAGTSTLQVTGWTFETFDTAGRTVERDALTASQFAQFFNSCGPGSSRILAQTDACAAVCTGLLGGTQGSAQVTVTATDAAGLSRTLGTPRVPLRPPQ